MRPEKGPGEYGRWSSGKKREVVPRIVRGEDLDALSRELAVTAARLAEWREAFPAGGQIALKSRAGGQRNEEIARPRAKVGELTMDKGLLELFFERVDPAHRPPLRRPSK